MAINTKSVKKIPIPKEISDRLILQLELENKYRVLNDILKSTMNNNRWIEINNKNFYFIPEDGVIIPNPQQISMKTKEYDLLATLEWGHMNERFAKKWFFINKSINPLIENDKVTYYTKNDSFEYRYINCYDTNGLMNIHDGSTTKSFYGLNGINSIDIPLYNLSSTDKADLLKFFIDNRLNIFKDDHYYRWFCLFTWLDGKMSEENRSSNSFFINDLENYNLVIVEMFKQGLTFDPDKSEERKKILDDNYCMDDEVFEQVKTDLLNCDKVRVNMDTYPEHILHDPNSGHWELWDDGNLDILANISSSLVARNPVYDALNNKSGVVGIDFGTKSTVVAYRQSTADVLPMRIGSGQFSRAVSKNDYENPTVIELRNIEKFLGAYKKYEGRPFTCWEDLLISHEASEQLKSEQSRGDTFATFFSELKQWASDKNKQVHLRDSKGKEVDLPNYLSLGDDDFDPIEIYAYNLGLFINNLEHKLFLRYKLSFPATAEKAVRDKILNSFTRGIKKSLPIQVLNDDSCMKVFKVEQGMSEPAAYAITALYGYNFDPENEEKKYYGIFDFGGGTTDFDFGVWSSEENEPENYDYQISHFGQGGDPYLGGENLLDILAFRVFNKNFSKLLDKKIVFTRPFGEKEVVGNDYLVCPDSQFAQFNQKRLMEKLRGVWEGDEEIRTEVKSGTITLPLFTMDGKSESNCPLDVDLDELDELLESKIDKGVAQFFEAFKNCFTDGDYIKYICDVNRFNIFLAGNSSKSPLVYKAFKKYIDKTEKPEWFNVYPPLGTELSAKIINGDIEPNIDSIIGEISGISNNDNTEFSVIDIDDEEQVPIKNEEIDYSSITKPNGKTGVAFGLLNNRVRVVQNETEEIGFRYYIGQNRKQKFYCVINKDNQKYNVWYKFCKASKEEFDIWFTRSAAAPTNKLPINQIGIHSELGVISDISSDKSVFIRLVSPTDIEYIVATDDEIMNISYDDTSVERVSLQEKH